MDQWLLSPKWRSADAVLVGATGNSRFPWAPSPRVARQPSRGWPGLTVVRLIGKQARALLTSGRNASPALSTKAVPVFDKMSQTVNTTGKNNRAAPRRSHKLRDSIIVPFRGFNIETRYFYYSQNNFFVKPGSEILAGRSGNIPAATPNNLDKKSRLFGSQNSTTRQTKNPTLSLWNLQEMGLLNLHNNNCEVVASVSLLNFLFERLGKFIGGFYFAGKGKHALV